MADYFDVFFHQQSIPRNKGTVLYQQDTGVEIADKVAAFYTTASKSGQIKEKQIEVFERIVFSSMKKYIEIQLFNKHLIVDDLLKMLRKRFPQFIWTQIVEDVDHGFITYLCEFISVVFKKEEQTIGFSILESLEQMGYQDIESVSELLKKNILLILSVVEKDVEPKNKKGSIVSFPVKMIIEEPEVEPETTTVFKSDRRRKINSDMLDSDDPAINEEDTIKETEEAVKSEIGFPIRSDGNEILYLRESLKRERAAKERVKIAKDKLEHELLAIENSLLMSGLQRFKKYRLSTIDREEWYKTIQIDLIQYDDLYRKAKFVRESWRLNCQLMTITEKMVVTKDQWSYGRARVEKLKNSVSEMDLQSMMEQCHLINDRVKVYPGFLFFKPKVKLFKIDCEQLEKISAFFDIIQTENRLLESTIEKKDVTMTN